MIGNWLGSRHWLRWAAAALLVIGVVLQIDALYFNFELARATDKPMTSNASANLLTLFVAWFILNSNAFPRQLPAHLTRTDRTVMYAALAIMALGLSGNVLWVLNAPIGVRGPGDFLLGLVVVDVCAFVGYRIWRERQRKRTV